MEEDLELLATRDELERVNAENVRLLALVGDIEKQARKNTDPYGMTIAIILDEIRLWRKGER